MLEINLLPGPKKKKAAGGAGLPISLDQIKAVLAQIKDPLLVGSIGAWAVSLALIGLFYVRDARRLSSLQDDLTRAQAEQRRFSALIAQKRKAEALRDSLIVELNVIRTIDGERFVWPHILEEVTRALPDYTWLVGLETANEGAGRAAGGAVTAQGADITGGPSVRFTIEGRTSDIQAYTRFLRQLANSPWITGIVAGATTTAIEQARAVTAFSLSASFRRADSAYIRTASLLQTLR